MVLGVGFAVGHGPSIAPGEPAEERKSFSDTVLVERLRSAIWQLNPNIPQEEREEPLRKVLLAESSSLIGKNRAFHWFHLHVRWILILTRR
jgi:type I restriction enzyme, R subunit